MRVRAHTIEVSPVARRGLATLQGHERRMAAHGEIVEAIAKLLEVAAAEWQSAGEQSIRDQEVRQARLQFEEARERLDAARDAAGDESD